MKIREEKGIAHIALILCSVALLSVVGFIVFQAVGKRGENRHNASDEKGNSTNSTWEWDGQKWSSNGNPPKCPDPLIVKSPIDVSSASAVLYPGQLRGQYKSHGGFRFEQPTNEVKVTAPLDAQVVEGSRYIEDGEVQYYFIFINDCGVAYRLDHLQKLDAKFQAIADSFPEPKENDSRTTKLDKPVEVKQGEVVATAVGYPSPLNVFMDFGLYDLRQPNGKTLNEAGKNPSEAQFNAYGLCWFNNLAPSDAERVKGLPPGDEKAGKTSDYCS